MNKVEDSLDDMLIGLDGGCVDDTFDNDDLYKRKTFGIDNLESIDHYLEISIKPKEKFSEAFKILQYLVKYFERFGIKLKSSFYDCIDIDSGEINYEFLFKRNICNTDIDIESFTADIDIKIKDNVVKALRNIQDKGYEFLDTLSNRNYIKFLLDDFVINTVINKYDNVVIYIPLYNIKNVSVAGEIIGTFASSIEDVVDCTKEEISSGFYTATDYHRLGFDSLNNKFSISGIIIDDKKQDISVALHDMAVRYSVNVNIKIKPDLKILFSNYKNFVDMIEVGKQKKIVDKDIDVNKYNIYFLYQNHFSIVNFLSENYMFELSLGILRGYEIDTLIEGSGIDDESRKFLTGMNGIDELLETMFNFTDCITSYDYSSIDSETYRLKCTTINIKADDIEAVVKHMIKNNGIDNECSYSIIKY